VDRQRRHPWIKDGWTEPSSHEVAQCDTVAPSLPGIGQEGLHCAQGHFGEFTERGGIEAVELPIDIEAVKDGQTD
jgi:hypothetical protein